MAYRSRWRSGAPAAGAPPLFPLARVPSEILTRVGHEAVVSGSGHGRRAILQGQDQRGQELRQLELDGDGNGVEPALLGLAGRSDDALEPRANRLSRLAEARERTRRAESDAPHGLALVK